MMFSEGNVIRAVKDMFLSTVDNKTYRLEKDETLIVLAVEYVYSDIKVMFYANNVIFECWFFNYHILDYLQIFYEI